MHVGDKKRSRSRARRGRTRPSTRWPEHVLNGTMTCPTSTSTTTSRFKGTAPSVTTWPLARFLALLLHVLDLALACHGSSWGRFT